MIFGLVDLVQRDVHSRLAGDAETLASVRLSPVTVDPGRDHWDALSNVLYSWLVQEPSAH